MGPIHLFDVASRVNHWLTVRQSAIAQNVANVNTPGFKAQDVKPFESTLEAMSLAMASHALRAHDACIRRRGPHGVRS